MSVNKVDFLDDHGTSKLAEELFSTISDNYLRMCALDTEMNSTSNNVVQNRAICSLLDTKQDEVYGFELDRDESDPASMIRYIGMNGDYRPVHMDFENDVFDYGDWADAWFIKGCKPCMLKYDGTVDYYLDPDNYSYQCTWHADGTYTRGSFVERGEGNVMVEIPTVWIKVDTTNAKKPKFWFAPTKLDESFHAYAHTDSEGNILKHIYLATYQSVFIGSDYTRGLRSRHNYNPAFYYMLNQNTTPSAMVQGCRFFNTHINTFDHIVWDMFALCDYELIALLLMLIGRSTDSQAIFGTGFSVSSSRRFTGSMDTKGLFWGSNNTDNGVKVFGIEHFWGSAGNCILGYIVDSNILMSIFKVQYDGGSRDSYKDYVMMNTTANSLVSAAGYSFTMLAFPTYGTSSYLTDMYVGDFGFIPSSAYSGGSPTTKYCDNISIYERGSNDQILCPAFGSTVLPSTTTPLGGGLFKFTFFSFNRTNGMPVNAYLTCKPPYER